MRHGPSDYEPVKVGTLRPNPQSTPIILSGLPVAGVRCQPYAFIWIVENHVEALQKLGAYQPGIILGGHQPFHIVGKSDRGVCHRIGTDIHPIGPAVSRRGPSPRAGSRLLQHLHVCGRDMVRIAERLVKVGVSVGPAIDEKTARQRLDTGEDDRGVDEWEAMFIHADRKRPRAGRRFVPARQINRHPAARIVHLHHKIVEQARPNNAVDRVTYAGFDAFQIDRD